MRRGESGELLSHFALRVEELQRRRAVGADHHHQPLAALRIGERHLRDAVAAATDEDSALVGAAGRAVEDGQARALELTVVDAHELHLFAGPETVEGETAAGVDDLALLVLVAGEDEAAVLAPLVVEEDQAG